MAQVEKIKALIREMMDQEMENYKDAVSLGTQDKTSAPVVYTMLQVLLTKIEKMPNEPANEDLEKEMNDFFLTMQVQDKEYINEDTFRSIARHFVDWQKEQLLANTADAMIGLPYENKDGGYTHLIDVSRPLPVGNNKIAIIFKEE